MTRAALGLILLSVTITACAQLALKAGMAGSTVQRAVAEGPGARMIVAIALNPFVIGGLALYVLSTLIWLLVLSKVDVSLAYPFVALGILLTTVFGHLVFHESLSPARIGGVLLVCGGVALLARS